MCLPKSLKVLFFSSVLFGLSNTVTPVSAAWPWINPEIYNTGDQISGAYFDPFTGKFVVSTERTRVRASYLDPARGLVDAGSLQFVDEVQIGANGVAWRVRGWKWTSNGVPHGDLKRTRRRNTGIPGVAHEENDRVVYSATWNNGNSKNRPDVKVGRKSNSSRFIKRNGRSAKTKQIGAGSAYKPF